MQLRGKLSARCSGSYDGHRQLLRPQCLGLARDRGYTHLPDAGGSVWPRSARPGRSVLCTPGVPKSLLWTAHRHNEGVVQEAALRRHLAAFVVDVGGRAGLHVFAGQGQSSRRCGSESHASGPGKEIDLVHREIHGPGSNLVQQRLPEMGARFVDERDIGELAPPSLSPRRVTSSRPPAPPPTTIIR